MAFSEKREGGGDGDFDDMSAMPTMSVDLVTDNITKRLMRNCIYTYVSEIVISCNPYKDIAAVYAPELCSDFDVNRSQEEVDALQPHIFSLARNAYKGAIGEGGQSGRKDQSILISGESGAGKTEATKLALRYFASMSAQRAALYADVSTSSPAADAELGDSIEDKLMNANPILEAMGNAKTTRNDNSSRFGKWLSLQLNDRGLISGGRVTKYLLEESRVVSQASGERNYHIFYQVAAAQSGYDPSQFHYLNQGGTVTVDNVNDKDDYGDLIEAFRSIGIAHGDRKTLCNAILGILHLGQLTFEAVDARSCRLGSECGADLAKAARFLLGDEEENDELRESAVQILETTLVTKKMNTGKETIDVPRSATEALLTRDAIAKLVYSNLFSHTVQLINEAIDKQGDTVTTDNVGGSKIGTLDIFGFELFEINSFEQLCINYANEKLQLFFNEVLTTAELKLYRLEALDVQDMEFANNSACVELLEGKGVSVMAVLADEVRTKNGSDQGFLDKLYLAQSKSLHFEKPRMKDGTFTIKHYAQSVSYTATGFVEKNRNKAGEDVVSALQNSRIALISAAFSSEADVETTPRASGSASGNIGGVRRGSRATGLGSQFKSQLGDLVLSIQSTTAHFVRCIKPNRTKTPGLIDRDMVQRQLMTSGVMDAVKVRHLGYSERLPHQHFLERYATIASSYFADASIKAEWANVKNADAGAKAAQLLQALTRDLVEVAEMSQWQKGKSKLFYKRSVLLALEHRRAAIRHKAITALQRRIRGVWARRECAAKLAAWKHIKNVIGTKNWDLLEEALYCARELGFTEPQLAVVLADYKRAQDLSSAQAFIAHALALAPGNTFKDSLKALAPALDQAASVARQHNLTEDEPLSRIMATGRELETVVSDFLTKLDAQQQSALEDPRGAHDIIAATCVAFGERRRSLISVLAPDLVVLKDDGDLDGDKFDVIMESAEQVVSELPEIVVRLDAVGSIEKVRSALAFAVKERDLSAIRENLNRVTDMGLTNMDIVEEARRCTSALQLEESAAAAVASGDTEFIREILTFAEEEDDMRLSPYMQAGGLLALQQYLRDSMKELEASRNYCVRLTKAIQAGNAGGLEAVLWESRREALQMAEAVEGLVKSAQDLLGTLRLQEASSIVLHQALAACDEKAPGNDVALCEMALEHAAKAGMGEEEWPELRRVKRKLREARFRQELMAMFISPSAVELEAKVKEVRALRNEGELESIGSHLSELMAKASGVLQQEKMLAALATVGVEGGSEAAVRGALENALSVGAGESRAEVVQAKAMIANWEATRGEEETRMAVEERRINEVARAAKEAEEQVRKEAKLHKLKEEKEEKLAEEMKRASDQWERQSLEDDVLAEQRRQETATARASAIELTLEQALTPRGPSRFQTNNTFVEPPVSKIPSRVSGTAKLTSDAPKLTSDGPKLTHVRKPKVAQKRRSANKNGNFKQKDSNIINSSNIGITITLVAPVSPIPELPVSLTPAPKDALPSPVFPSSPAPRPKSSPVPTLPKSPAPPSVPPPALPLRPSHHPPELPVYPVPPELPLPSKLQADRASPPTPAVPLTAVPPISHTASSTSPAVPSAAFAPNRRSSTGKEIRAPSAPPRRSTGSLVAAAVAAREHSTSTTSNPVLFGMVGSSPSNIRPSERPQPQRTHAKEGTLHTTLDGTAIPKPTPPPRRPRMSQLVRQPHMSPLFKPVVNKAIDLESSGDEEEENVTAAATLLETTRLLPAVRQLSTRFGTLLKLAPGTLFITIHSAGNLVSTHKDGKVLPFVLLAYKHAKKIKKKQTKILKRTDNPEWEETVKFTVRDPESDTLNMIVAEHETRFKRTELGHLMFQVSHIAQMAMERQGNRGPHKLQRVYQLMGVPHGELFISMRYEEDEAKKQKQQEEADKDKLRVEVQEDKSKKLRKKLAVKKYKKFALFSATIEEVMECQRDLLEIEADIPVFLEHLIDRISECGCEEEGIFRVSASTEDLARVRRQLEAHDYDVSKESAHTCAGVLKKWLRDCVREPLIPDELYDQCMEIGKRDPSAQDGSKVVVVQQLSQVARALPPVHLRILRRLVQLASKLSSPENIKKTRMSVENLAIVLYPSMIRSRSSDPSTMLAETKPSCHFAAWVLNSNVFPRHLPQRN